MVLKGGSNLSKYSFLIREIKHSMREHDSSITHIRHTSNSVVMLWQTLVEASVVPWFGLVRVQMRS